MTMKKLLCLLTMLLALAFSSQAVNNRNIMGDVNGDNEVNIADVSALIDLLVSDETTAACDINGDGDVSIADINALIDMILNGYVDPHDTGYWLLIFDKYDEPVWYELFEDSRGDYQAPVSLEDPRFGDSYDIWTYYYETGKRLSTQLYIVIDGIRYGAENDNEEIVLGTALDNPLIPSYSSYTIPVGFNFNVGVARFEGNLYMYAAQAGFVSN